MAHVFSQHVVAYAISRSLINVAAFVTYPEKEGTVYEDTCPSAEEIQELVSLYTKWEPKVQVLIKVGIFRIDLLCNAFIENKLTPSK